MANVGVCNTAKQLARLWLPGNHDGRPVSLPKQAHAAVESKVGRAVGRITSVAAEAGVREDRADVALEINPLFLANRPRAKQQ